jgi:hypothetical protein
MKCTLDTTVRRSHPFPAGLRLKAKMAVLFPMCWFPLVVAAQSQTVIPLASEPHHHLLLHNQYLNLYKVEVAPHDSVLLHRYDFDAISIMMSDTHVTVHTPGKPEAQHQVVDGQIRLQPRGYVHSTLIDGDAAYRNVTIELLLPQEGARNLCATVIATQPLDCPAAQASRPHEAVVDQPQFETDQTSVSLIRVLPHQEVTRGDPERAELIVAVDEDVSAKGDGRGTQHVLHSGDFVWLDRGKATQIFKNQGAKEARLISFRLRPTESAEAASHEVNGGRRVVGGDWGGKSARVQTGLGSGSFRRNLLRSGPKRAYETAGGRE